MIVRLALAGNQRGSGGYATNRMRGLQSRTIVDWINHCYPEKVRGHGSGMGIMGSGYRCELVPLTDAGKNAVREACGLAGIHL